MKTIIMSDNLIHIIPRRLSFVGSLRRSMLTKPRIPTNWAWMLETLWKSFRKVSRFTMPSLVNENTNLGEVEEETAFNLRSQSIDMWRIKTFRVSHVSLLSMRRSVWMVARPAQRETRSSARKLCPKIVIGILKYWWMNQKTTFLVFN